MLPGTEKQYEVDAVCLGYALHPSNELARSLGCEHELAAPGLLVPKRDRHFQTGIDGVYVVGDSGVLGGAHVAMAEGRLAARAVLGNLSKNKPEYSRRDRRLLRRHRRFQRHLWSMYEAPDITAALPDTPLCRCELVTLDTVTTLIESGVHDLGSLKRRCRAGMGPCQGRYCQKRIAKILAGMTGTAPAANDMLAPQLPVKPTLIANVAAEKPEWLGYRSVTVPTRSKRNESKRTTRDRNLRSGHWGRHHWDIHRVVPCPQRYRGGHRGPRRRKRASIRRQCRQLALAAALLRLSRSAAG